MNRLVSGLSAFALLANPLPDAAYAQGQTAPLSIQQAAQRCKIESLAARPLSARSIIEAATQEWQRFGARSFAYNTSTPEYRTIEADWVELNDARFDKLENTFTWGRVYSYWRAVGATSYLEFARTIRRETDGTPIRNRENEIRRATVPLNEALTALGSDQSLNAAQKEAFRIAAIRASLIEQPWSAVFVTSMMRVAGLNEDTFPNAFSHSQYMRKALERTQRGSAAIRYLACPPTSEVEVQPGDLICNGRNGTAGKFDTLWNATDGFDSHCDIVVNVGRKLQQFEIMSIGGNVQDTVLRTTYQGTGRPTLGNVAKGKAWIAVLILQ